MKRRLEYILREPLKDISESLPEIHLEALDLVSIRLLRSLNLFYIWLNEYKLFKNVLDFLPKMDSYELHLLADLNFGMRIDESDGDFISEVELSLKKCNSENFVTQNNIIDDLGFFMKHKVSVIDSSMEEKRFGIVYAKFSLLETELNRELFYFDIMSLSEVLGWNIVVVNLENRPGVSDIQSFIARNREEAD